MTPVETLNQLRDLTVKLVEIGLCDEQNFPALRDHSDGIRSLTIPGTPDFSVAMRNMEYRAIYTELDRTKSFNFRMLDGAIVQLLYTFQHDVISTHRLAYFPSPHLETFQRDPDLYLEDEVYADILSKNVVPFPIRFDFDASESKHVEVRHPKSHLTLGQYLNCRIPVAGPLAPVIFVRFLLQHFYNTAYYAHEEKINIPLTYFADSITELERSVPHLRLRTDQ